MSIDDAFSATASRWSRVAVLSNGMRAILHRWPHAERFGPFLDEIKAISEQYEPDTEAQPQIERGRDALVVPLAETRVVGREFETDQRLQDHAQSKNADPTAGRAE